MPKRYRTPGDGEQWPGMPLSVQLANGRWVSCIWAGSAQEEKLSWWLGKSGNELAQSDLVATVALEADDNGEVIWSDAPPHGRLLFVIEKQSPERNYRLAKMVTIAATPAQVAHYRHERFVLFGLLRYDGSIYRISPP